MGISENLESVLKKIDIAAQKTGRKSSDITLISVSKYHTCEEIMQVYRNGHINFGENHVQELLEKKPALPQDINWHFIGHLQTNKVSKLIDKITLLHSLDRLNLAKEIDKRAKAKNIIINALVQVNITDSDKRFGVLPADTIEFVKQIADFSNIKIKGLMGMAPICDNPSDHFKILKHVFDELKVKNLCETKYLSMGMSADYESAISEGSNMIRIGSQIFGPRRYN